MNWRRGRNSSPPGTGGVARSAGVVAESNNSPPHSFIGIKENHFDFTTTPGPPSLDVPPLLFQEGSCSSLSSNSFTPSVTAPTAAAPHETHNPYIETPAADCCDAWRAIP